MFEHKFWTSLLAIVFTIGLGYYAMSSVPASAGPTDKVKGWVWSDNIGWIKMNNCDFQNVCTSPVFGVNYDSSGIMSGYAWSDNVGWITFNSADLAGCPSGTCNARINLSTTPRRMEGWAKVISLQNPNDTETSTDWADGWVSLYASAPTAYGPIFSASGSGSGFAWGSEVLGWLDFSLVSLDVIGTPIVQIMSHTISACPAPFSVNLVGQVDPNGYTPLPLAVKFQNAGADVNATISSASGPINTSTQSSIPLPAENTAYPIKLVVTQGSNTWEDTYTVWTPFCPVISGPDVCPNLPGDQGSVPPGMSIDINGNCIFYVPPAQRSVVLSDFCTTPPPQGVLNVQYTNVPSADCTITGGSNSYTFTTADSGNGIYSFNANNDTYITSCTFGSTTVSSQESSTVNSTDPSCTPCTNSNGCTTPGTKKPIFKEI